MTNKPLSFGDVLVPVALVALVLFLSLGFQTTQIMRERESVRQFLTQQDKPLEESRKIQAQVSALALGTKKLADGGDKNATAIIGRMQQLGITVGSAAPASSGNGQSVAPTPEQ